MWVWVKVRNSITKPFTIWATTLAMAPIVLLQKQRERVVFRVYKKKQIKINSAKQIHDEK